jgi:hypothetical protein
MDANAKLDATLLRKTSVSLDHAVLHLDCTPNGIDYAAKLNDASIAGALHHTSVVDGYCGVNQITTERPQPRQCSVLVGASEPAVSDYIRSQDCYELPGFDHGTPRAARIIA